MAIRPADHGVIASSAGGEITATGGDTVTDYTQSGVSYRAHTFTSSGSFVLTANPNDQKLELLNVDGGGGAGTASLSYTHLKQQTI